VSLWSSVSGALAALRPPRSSVLPPRAGNKANKAIQPKKDRANKLEERYIDEPGVLDRYGHPATISRHGDGDAAAIPTVEQTQGSSPMDADFLCAAPVCGSGSLAGCLECATMRTSLNRTVSAGGWTALVHALPARSEHTTPTVAGLASVGE